ncbi:amidase family protein [Cnuibacter sp. UC19_7]|uniref:amidase family protein n=1 Tax=Cnuibacter sp. UC19_7 TaxID=3350166 RepID=UPI00366FAA58
MIVADATTALRMLAAGEVSAVELVSAHLDLIERRGDEVNAVVVVDRDRALAEARVVDARRAAGEDTGPLGGLPMTVKDSFAVAGMPASDGRVSSRLSPVEDAPAVRRLRAAGAVILGKTNVPDELGDHQTRSELYGVTRNPWDRARTPGGSSGGSAAAVAAGLSAADLGSDLAGSIRVPSAWSGVFGHVPSHGVISKRGHLPRPLGSRLEPPLSLSGPIARSADDLALLLGILAGPATHGEPSPSLSPAAATTLRDTRVLVWSDASAPTTREQGDAVARLADGISDAGARVAELKTDWPGVVQLFGRLVAGELSYGTAGSPASWADVEEQFELSEEWDRRLAGALVIAPPTFGSAPLLDEGPQGERLYDIDGIRHPAGPITSAWSALVNTHRVPATIVPVGLDSAGLPLGAQIVGPRLGDRATIEFARLLTQAGLIGFAAPPGW